MFRASESASSFPSCIHIFGTACKLGLSSLKFFHRHFVFSHPETMPKQPFRKYLPCPLAPRKFDNGKLSQRVTSTWLVKTDFLLCERSRESSNSWRSLPFLFLARLSEGRGSRVENHFEPFKWTGFSSSLSTAFFLYALALWETPTLNSMPKMGGWRGPFELRLSAKLTWSSRKWMCVRSQPNAGLGWTLKLSKIAAEGKSMKRVLRINRPPLSGCSRSTSCLQTFPVVSSSAFWT